MSQKTNIEWTDATWNPVTGCDKVSAGCKHCYAEVMAKRLQAMNVANMAAGKKSNGYENGFEVTVHSDRLNEPFKIKKPSRIFVCSMSDLFHRDIFWSAIHKIMDVIEKNPQHSFQILTKRSENMANYFLNNQPPANTWLGVTVENKADGLLRIDYLRKIETAKVKFLSCEPLLEDLGELDLTGIDWVIVGGESGKNARPMHPDWVRNIQRQCQKQGVAFFFKQWGGFIPYEYDGNFWFSQNGCEGIDDFYKTPNKLKQSKDLNVFFKKVGKTLAGNLLDGVEYRAIPEVV